MPRILFVVAIAAACSSPPNVGHVCSAMAPDCDVSLTCISTIPGGYCTLSCGNAGSTAECPEDSICDSLSSLGNYCVKLCDVSADCGRTDVGCNGVSGSNLKACKPN